jgi:hypothetical protein
MPNLSAKCETKGPFLRKYFDDMRFWQIFAKIFVEIFVFAKFTPEIFVFPKILVKANFEFF